MPPARGPTRWEHAVSVFADGPKTVIPYTRLLSALDKGGQWQRALFLLEGLQQAQLQLDTILYNVLISACSKGARWETSLHLLEGLQKERLEADVITHNAVMSSCERASLWTAALAMFEQLTDTMRPTLASYSTAISALAGEWQHALLLLHRSREDVLHGWSW